MTIFGYFDKIYSNFYCLQECVENCEAANDAFCSDMESSKVELM